MASRGDAGRRARASRVGRRTTSTASPTSIADDLPPGTIVEVRVDEVVDDYDFRASPDACRERWAAPCVRCSRPASAPVAADRGCAIRAPVGELRPVTTGWASRRRMGRDVAGRTVAPERRATTSAAIMARARALFPGGVNSPVRAFGGVGGRAVRRRAR